MDKKTRNSLGEPIASIVGYCQSAKALDKNSRHKEWAEGLVKLATKLDVAWKHLLEGQNHD